MKAVRELGDRYVRHSELTVGDVEGRDVVVDEGCRLRRGEVAVLLGEGERRRINGVGKLGLVAGVAREIDGAAHEKQEGNHHECKKHGDIAALLGMQPA